MGIFGPSTRKFGDKVYQCEAEFAEEGDAKHWAEEYRRNGYPTRILPNASTQKFELWVCVGVIPRIEDNQGQKT